MNNKSKWIDISFSNYVMNFIELKRGFEFLELLQRRCKGKRFTNDLLFFQFGFSFDGLIVYFANFNREFSSELRKSVSIHHRREASLSRLIAQAENSTSLSPSIIGNVGNKAAQEIRQNRSNHSVRRVMSKFKRMFPEANERGNDHPTKGDILGLATKYENITFPIKKHRDTCVAHWDDLRNRRPANQQEVRRVIKKVENFFSEIEFVFAYRTIRFEMGGVAVSIRDTVNAVHPLLVR